MKAWIAAGISLLALVQPLQAHADIFSQPPGGGVDVKPGNLGITSTLTLAPGASLRGDVVTKPSGASAPSKAPASRVGKPCYPINAVPHAGGWAIVEPLTFALGADGSTAVTFPSPSGGIAGPFGSGAGTLGQDTGPPGAPQTWGSFLASHTFVDYVTVTPGHYVPITRTDAFGNVSVIGAKCDQSWTFDTSGPNYLPPTGSWTPAAPCGGNTCTTTAFFATSSLSLVTGLGTGQLHSLPRSGSPAFVNTPTCAWISTGLPEPSGTSKYIDSPTHTVVTSDARGSYVYGVFLEARITGANPRWDFGDGTVESGMGPGNDPGNRIPQWNPLDGTWSATACSVSHDYRSVSPGLSISTSQRFNVTFRAFYNRGGAYGAVTIPCDVNDPDHCAPVISPTHGAPGWSVTHEVDQIYGVPYLP